MASEVVPWYDMGMSAAAGAHKNKHRNSSPSQKVYVVEEYSQNGTTITTMITTTTTTATTSLKN